MSRQDEGFTRIIRDFVIVIFTRTLDSMYNRTALAKITSDVK